MGPGQKNHKQKRKRKMEKNKNYNKAVNGPYVLISIAQMDTPVHTLTFYI
jgi:hypothetical protein